MSRIIIIFVASMLTIVPSAAMSGPAPEKPAPAPALGDTFVLDNFENGNLKSPRDWWTFDLNQVKAVSNSELNEGDETAAGEVGKYSMLLQGETSNWYAGGAGTYIAQENQDLSKFNTLVIDVYGRGEGSGTLKIELFDDDNGNYQIEQDPADNYAATEDDKLVYNIAVDWEGWQRVSLPLADFVDDNPDVGDDVWNPQQKNDSGGLLQIQFITLAGAEEGGVNLNVDNITLTTAEE